jgi:hypothetical protein
MSYTGQYIIVLTQGTSNNVYYSTNYGSTFTALTIGSVAMTGCSISADGSYITVSNATNVYTLNLNTNGYTVSVGNAAGLLNQGLNAIAIGNQAGVNNQSAGSIVLNSSGTVLDAYNSGFYVSNIADYVASYAPSFSLLGYGSDKQVVQGSAITLMPSGNVGIGTTNPFASLHVYNSNTVFTGAPTVLIGDGQIDAGGNYGMLQLVRANNGADNKAHLSFIKNGLTVFGMGYYPGASQSVFGLVPSFGTMATNTGLWMTTGGNVGIGTTSPSYLFHGYGNVNSGIEQYFQNANSGSSAYTLIGCRNNTPSQVVLFLNSSTRTPDGGINTATLRNDAGALRLQSAGATTNGNIFIAATSGYVGIGNTSPSYTLDVNGTARVYGAGDNTFNTYYPNGGSWNATLNIGSGTDRGTAQVLTTNGNLHLDGAPGYTMYYGYYANSRGSANGHQFYGGVTFNSNITGGEIYANSWFRVNGGGGLYLESYGRGIWSADSAGASYGNVSTYGTGINTWNGYDINGRYCFMANGDTVGIHDRNYTWAFRSVNGTSYIDRTLSCNGYVGIGTASPSVPLHVSSYAYYAYTTYISESYNGGYGYYIYYNGGTTQWTNYGTNFSIYARYAIISSTYTVGASDERIKTNIKPIQNALSKIQQLNVVSYDRIDYKERGADAGVLARNVQNVLPRAVHVSVYTLPNIYATATHRVFNDMILITVPCTDSNIKEGCKVKLMIMTSPTNEIEYESVMVNWTGSSFEVKPWDDYSVTDNVFVYGVEVNDFLNVDKEQIGILAAGAVKELSYKVEEQAQQIQSLTDQNSVLNMEVADLKAKLDLVMAKLDM